MVFMPRAYGRASDPDSSDVARELVELPHRRIDTTGVGAKFGQREVDESIASADSAQWEAGLP